MFRRVPSCVLLLALFAALPASALRPWYGVAHEGKQYVNTYLTPVRAVGRDVTASWNGQLVLWTGRVLTWRTHKGQTWLDLDVGCGQPVHVHFRGPAINLENDRTSYRVAVKGFLLIDNHRLQGLDGKSMILLAPPPSQSYAHFEQIEKQPCGIESFLEWWISFHTPRYDARVRHVIASAIVKQARRNGLDPLLLASLIQIESAFRPDVVSSCGAIGLGQLMPFTARGYGVDPWNPSQNVKAAARMISGLIRSWNRGTQDPRALALAGYNAGPNCVRCFHGIPPIPQTTNYVYFIGFVHRQMTEEAIRCGVLPARPTILSHEGT